MKKNIEKFLKIYFLILILLLLISFLIYSIFVLIDFENIRTYLNEKGFRYDTYSVSFEEGIPDFLKESIVLKLENIEKEGKKRFEILNNGEGDIQVHLSKNGIFSDFLIPVGHFYWIENNFTYEDLKELDIFVPKGYGGVLNDYSVVEVENMLEVLKDVEGNSIGFIPFKDLNYEFQVLYLENEYFLEDGGGILKWGIGVQNFSSPGFVFEIVFEEIFNLNEEFNLNSIGKINMSGVTALSRNLAFKIEQEGRNDYPAELIYEFLSDADIVHTSNEVSFVPDCRPESSMRFCSHPKYIETLERIGVNIVELTGNHNNDFGYRYNAESIDMYKERGWNYYGGGLNDEDASKVLYVDVKGNTVAFLGYNYYDSVNGFMHNIAGVDRAGANFFSFEKMESDINEAKKKSDVVIVTFQFTECYSYPRVDMIYPFCYRPLETPDQKEVFRKAVDYGANVVIGSQAHQPQTYEIYEDSLIFYGTGNIFFDQIQWIGTRQGMVLSHYVYDGSIVQSKISTTIYEDDMRPYVTIGEERDLLLNLLREARVHTEE